MEWREHIMLDPNVCHGKGCVKGTHAMVSVVPDNLAAGVPQEGIPRCYPSLDPQSIRAAVAYAAELARGRVVDLSA